MAQITGIGTSALQSLQQALATVGHNIANVNTPGYSRQQVEMATLSPEFTGAGYIGTGVQVTGVRRAYDQFLTAQVQAHTAAKSSVETYAAFSGRVDALMANPQTGLNPALEKFFAAVQGVANSPASLPERQAMLAEGQALVDRFHSIDQSLANLGEETNGRLSMVVADINGLARDIARLNQEIVAATGMGGRQPPNDLLDQRDQLIANLSQKVGINTVIQSDGSVNITVGSGQALVVGTSVGKLVATPDPFQADRLEVGIEMPSGAAAIISRFLSGGEIQGVLDVRTQVLDPARSRMGLLAAGVADTFNAQHRLGLDLNGQPGADFFDLTAPAVLSGSGNVGSATPAASIADVGALQASDYRLSYDGAQWQVSRLADGHVTAGAGPFSLDGLTINVPGVAAAGDSFLIRPVNGVASAIGLHTSDIGAIAAASPVRAQTALANGGNLTVSNLTAADAGSLPLATPVTLTFNPNALGPGVPGFDVAGGPAGPLAYDPASESAGKSFALTGFGELGFTLKGTPQAGDSVMLGNNAGGVGDNANAVLLAGLQTKRILNGGDATYGDAYGGLVSDIGVKSRQANNGLATETTLLQQATSSRDAVSGVNLEEEAANLMRLQQAYQAAAQIVAMADRMFQTLIDATRR